MQSRVQSLMPPRKGFTLLELLIVIAIIGMLTALLLPMLSAMRRNAQVVKVKTEIKNLEAAIAGFHNVYGIDPPSRFRLYEDTHQYLVPETHSDPRVEAILNADRLRSMAILRQIWPRFNFGTNGFGNAVDGNDVNWNGSSSTNEGYTLNGAECLVFFLGGRIVGIENGRINANIPGAGIQGFSKNPIHPFALGGNREPPFFEFDTGRIQDVFVFDNACLSDTSGAAGLPEYLDLIPSQTLPYWYMSSYGAKGYNPFQKTNPQLNFHSKICFKTQDGQSRRVEEAFYKQNKSVAHNQTSFQLVSAGFDEDYGTFGIFNPADPGQAFPTPNPNDPNPAYGIGEGDHDNITNFSDGMLGP